MYEDPIVDEVRKTRECLAEKYNFDVRAIFEDLRKRQATLGKRLVQRERKGAAYQTAVSEPDSAAPYGERDLLGRIPEGQAGLEMTIDGTREK